VTAVVTASGDLDPASPLWAPGAASLVLTCEAAPVARLRALAGDERVILAGEDRVDPVRAVAALADRGLRRVLVEGGPTLLGALAAAGVLDELCLTWSPLVVGGDGPRIAHGAPAELRLRAAHLLEAGGLLLGRWTVVPPQA
jgi:riboflavin biosynthesis pyrimidine reductase